MEETHEDYLDIAEPAIYDSSVEKISYITVEPPASRKLNDFGDITLTVTPSADWLLPSQGYIYIEGKLLIWNPHDPPHWETIPSDAQGEYSPVGLCNNAIMHLFSSARYSLNDIEIEGFNYPGYLTTIKGLLSLPKSFSGLDQCWAIDDYDGGVVFDKTYFPITDFTAADLACADPPTKAEYLVFMLLYIDKFKITENEPDIPNLAPSQMPCDGANPTKEELLIAFNNVIENIDVNVVEDLIDRLKPDDIPNNSKASVLAALNKVVALINTRLVYSSSPFRANTGYRARREYILNPFRGVMPKENAGMFSYRIPLSFIFNFCEQYKKSNI